MMQALERQGTAAEPVREAAPKAAGPEAPGEEDPFSRLPRVVSVQKI